MQLIARYVRKRVALTFGIGDSSTRVSIKLAQYAQELGADCVMLQPPYYFSHSNPAIEQHFLLVAQAIDIPVMFYDGGGGIEVPLESLLRVHTTAPNIRSSAGLYKDDRIIIISGCSKTYAMTGWRLGYILAAPSLSIYFTKVQESLISCASTISQYAAEAAIRGEQSCVEQMRTSYRRRREIVREILGPASLLTNVPHGAFYALIDLRSLNMTSENLALLLLEEEQVATTPGRTFGLLAEGMVRISFSVEDEDLLRACQRIKKFVKRHQEGRTNVPENKVIEFKNLPL
ncbi:MAG: hypothetical protein PVS3B1_01410 [Ktedonobacteraceae bacterium]